MDGSDDLQAIILHRVWIELRNWKADEGRSDRFRRFSYVVTGNCPTETGPTSLK